VFKSSLKRGPIYTDEVYIGRSRLSVKGDICGSEYCEIFMEGYV